MTLSFSVGIRFSGDEFMFKLAHDFDNCKYFTDKLSCNEIQANVRLLPYPSHTF